MYLSLDPPGTNSLFPQRQRYTFCSSLPYCYFLTRESVFTLYQTHLRYQTQFQLPCFSPLTTPPQTTTKTDHKNAHPQTTNRPHPPRQLHGAPQRIRNNLHRRLCNNLHCHPVQPIRPPRPVLHQVIFNRLHRAWPRDVRVHRRGVPV